MVESTLIDDFLEYEGNAFMGLTFRQAVLSVLGVILIAVAYFFIDKSLGTQAASYMAIFMGLPCFLFAFMKPNKMPLEEFIVMWVCANLLSPRHLPYQSENEAFDILEAKCPQTKFDVVLREYDMENQCGIPGVRLHVQAVTRKKGKQAYADVCEACTDQDGLLQLADLDAGVYRWIETDTPPGYHAPTTKAQYFKIHKSGKQTGIVGLANKPVVEKPVVEKKQKTPHAPKMKNKAPNITATVVQDAQGNVIGYLTTNNKGEQVVIPIQKNESEGI